MGSPLPPKYPYNLIAAGLDYIAVTMTLNFAAEQTRVSVPVDTIDDQTAELQEGFTALLSNPSEGLALGQQDTGTVIILEDEGEAFT
jgi:hypothetical protein